MATKLTALLALVAALACLQLAASSDGAFNFAGTASDAGIPSVAIRRSNNKALWLLPLQIHKNYKPNVTELPATVVLSGHASVQSYLANNCTSKRSTSIQLEVELVAGADPTDPFSGLPVAGFSFTGGVFTESCQNLFSANNALYKLNANNTANFLWFDKATTDDDGIIRGDAATAGFPSPPLTKMRSVVLFERDEDIKVKLAEDPAWYFKNGKAMFCTNLGMPTKTWSKDIYALFKQGKAC